MRVKDVILGLVSLALIGAGATLIATFFMGPQSVGEAPEDRSQDFNVPVLEETNGGAAAGEGASGPEDETLVLNVPKMALFDAPVPTTTGDDEESLKNFAAIHLDGTGYPWQDESNVYIAGHRLGYPDTPSFLAFYDLDILENGDEVTVSDADGRAYTYEVYKKIFVGPTDLYVTEPVEGKDVLTLQTCTLPDYSQRLVVQAEKAA